MLMMLDIIYWLSYVKKIEFFVIPILNVSRKFSMCIIFSTEYIKIYNINFFEWIFYTKIRVRTINNTILHVQSI